MSGHQAQLELRTVYNAELPGDKAIFFDREACGALRHNRIRHGPDGRFDGSGSARRPAGVDGA